MTGPLAQQFAQLRDTLTVDWPTSMNQCSPIEQALAALSVIERHVRDMARWEEIAKDWRYSNEFLGQVVRQKWPAEFPRAALPASETPQAAASGTRNRVAREKGTE